MGKLVVALSYHGPDETVNYVGQANRSSPPTQQNAEFPKGVNDVYATRLSSLEQPLNMTKKLKQIDYKPYKQK